VLLPARQQLRFLGPEVPDTFVSSVYDLVLLLSPVKVVVPALPALLADTPVQMLGNDGPLLGAIPVHRYIYTRRVNLACDEPIW
jgi:hypothetical protein